MYQLPKKSCSHHCSSADAEAGIGYGKYGGPSRIPCGVGVGLGGPTLAALCWGTLHRGRPGCPRALAPGPHRNRSSSNNSAKLGWPRSLVSARIPDATSGRIPVPAVIAELVGAPSGGVLVVLSMHDGWPVEGKSGLEWATRTASRCLLLRQAELDHFPPLFLWNPAHAPLVTARYVKVNDLCHGLRRSRSGAFSGRLARYEGTQIFMMHVHATSIRIGSGPNRSAATS